MKDGKRLYGKLSILRGSRWKHRCPVYGENHTLQSQSQAGNDENLWGWDEKGRFQWDQQDYAGLDQRGPVDESRSSSMASSEQHNDTRRRKNEVIRRGPDYTPHGIVALDGRTDSSSSHIAGAALMQDASHTCIYAATRDAARHDIYSNVLHRQHDPSTHPHRCHRLNHVTNSMAVDHPTTSP
jgi:hypothetical protein